MRGSKARLRTSAAHAPPQPSGAGRWRCCTGRPEGWHGISAREAADRRRRSRADRMVTSAPNECRLKGGTRKHLRRQAEQLPLIRRHSTRRTHRQFFSYRKAKTGTSPFIYGHVVIFMPEKMGKLQNFRVCHYRRENDIITTFFDGETVSLNESNDNFMATSSIKSIYENCRT